MKLTRLWETKWKEICMTRLEWQPTNKTMQMSSTQVGVSTHSTTRQRQRCKRGHMNKLRKPLMSSSTWKVRIQKRLGKWRGKMLIYLWKSHLSKAVWAAFLMLRTLRTISAQFAWEMELSPIVSQLNVRPAVAVVKGQMLWEHIQLNARIVRAWEISFTNASHAWV